MQRLICFCTRNHMIIPCEIIPEMLHPFTGFPWFEPARMNTRREPWKQEWFVSFELIRCEPDGVHSVVNHSLIGMISDPAVTWRRSSHRVSYLLYEVRWCKQKVLMAHPGKFWIKDPVGHFLHTPDTGQGTCRPSAYPWRWSGYERRILSSKWWSHHHYKLIRWFLL